MRLIAKPSGLFGGANFMTPHVCGYYKLRHGYAELSEGEGLTHNPIYGVTVRNSAGQDPANLSRMFTTMGRALGYIKALS